MRRIITARNNTILSPYRPNLLPKRQHRRNLPPLQHQLLWQKRRLQRKIPNRRRITITKSRRQRHPGVPVYRYVLSARNLFFKNVFSVNDRGSSLAATRLELKELAKEYDVELDVVLTILGYVYSEKLRLLPKAFASAWMTLALMSLVDRWLISWWRFCMFLQLFKSPN
ncbi:hypothetical protein ACFX2F_010306 [Malus domestica]